MFICKEPKNKSVKNIMSIAARYGYKAQVIWCGNNRAFMSVSGNSLRSPYPSHMTSNVVSAKYLEQVWDRWCDGNSFE